MIRILFLADSHLGFDLPFRPRVKRRRRGEDFFRNYDRCLSPCFRGEVDCVVHGGDVLYRSKVPAALVEMAFSPLKKVADTGVPVFVCPGNHERSQIPYALLAIHPNIHIFDRPRTFFQRVNGCTLALAGFPYVPQNIRNRFPEMLRKTGWQKGEVAVRLLCIHHCVEGATVGPANYTFRYGSDVIKGVDIPSGLDAVLSGHIHRAQILKRDLKGNPIAAPVFYPGSIERTSLAERNEKKGHFILEIDGSASKGKKIRKWRFIELPAAPPTPYR